jgi:hypothetical protein
MEQGSMNNPITKDIADKLDKIYLAVVGDDKLGIKGTNQRLQETQGIVDDHGKRITKIEDYNRRKKWAVWMKGVGIGFGSGMALGGTKIGAAVAKVLTAAGAAIFLMYLLMLIL